MNRIHLAAIILSLTAASAGAATDVLWRALLADTIPNAARTVMLENPALESLRLDVSSSTIDAGWTGGEKHSAGFFNARAFMPLGRGHHVSGHATYANGTQRDVAVIQNADPHITSPYLMAVDAVGDMRQERYTFGGTYSRYAPKSHAWGWGAHLSYDAGLSYRGTDPRPRNVTGNLALGAAASWSPAAKYTIAAAVGADIYKQSNNLKFVSEIGELPVYHLTGLGTYYHRFTALGKDAFYKGQRWHANIALTPVGASGFYAAATAGTARCENILKDLNELPMAHTVTRDIDIQCGWHGTWTPWLRWQAARQRGTENIFGDAATGVYPLIGSATTYARNSYAATAGVTGSFGKFSTQVHTGYSHDIQAYGGDRPRSADTDLWLSSLQLRYATLIADKNLVTATIELDNASPLRRYIRGLGDTPMELFAISQWQHQSAARTSMGVAADYARQLSRAVALGLGLKYSHTFSSDNLYEKNNILISVKLYL